MEMLHTLNAALAGIGLSKILLYLGGVNLLTFALYAADKRAAMQQGPRIPEKALHLLALAGGSPAAYFAQRHFSHKMRKDSFQAMFWLIVMGQAVVVGAAIL